MDYEAKQAHFAEHKAKGDSWDYMFAGLGVFLTSPTTDPAALGAEMDAASRRACPPRLTLVPAAEDDAP